MASWITFPDNEIYWLDPFAGAGMLTAAACDSLLKTKHPIKIKADLFEADPELFSILQKNLATIKSALESDGHEFQFTCTRGNFLAANAGFLEDQPLFSHQQEPPEYDFIIASLPDFRLTELDLPKAIFASGHIDSFVLLLRLAARLLAKNGELITLMPRKYGAGLFYKTFRKWFLSKLKPLEFCLLPQEQLNFQVFAEPVLVKLKKTRLLPERIPISAATAPNFQIENSVDVPADEVLQRRDPDRIIHIPVDTYDLELLKYIQSWPMRLDGLGFRAASGKITSSEVSVMEIPKNPDADESWLPVIRAQHLKEFSLEFPNPQLKKIQQVATSETAREFAMKNQRYVLVNRLHQKNRKYPLLAIYYAPASFANEEILLDQQVNYISRQRGKFSLFEALGIMALLNSEIIHRYLTLINGHRQVSTSQLNHLPMPGIEQIVEIGTALNSEKILNRNKLNQIVMEKLNTPVNLQQELLPQ